MKSAKKLLAPAVIQAIRKEIESVGGNEVFFLGNTDENRVVSEVVPLAHGNAGAVPAITQLARPGDVVIHNHPNGPLSPSEADLSIASSIGQAGVGCYIVNNSVTRVYEVVAAFEHEKIEPLRVEQLCDALKPGGPVAKKLTKYEHREQQVEMLRAVANAFNTDGIAVIEAGTGTGKTFAYLIPAIFWAVSNRERVVISTNTINLQEQLVRRDIPTLLSTLDIDCKAVLVKGRSNYVCLRKLKMVENEFEILTMPEEREMLESIIDWSKRTKDGSLSDLGFVPKQEIWEKVNSESDTCLRARCGHFNECFVNRARREAASADLLIVNHHLLFADLSLRSMTQGYSDMAVLPGYRRIIFDEAHNIEDSATSYFGARVTRVGLLRLLGRIHNRQSKQQEGGLISLVRRKLLGVPGKNDHIEEIVLDIQNEVIPRKRDLEHLTDEACGAIFEFLCARASKTNGEVKLRVGPDLQDDEQWRQECVPAVEHLLNELRAFAARVHLVLRKLQEIGAGDIDEFDFTDDCIELEAMCNRLEIAAETIEDTVFGDSLDRIRWVEVRPRGPGNIVRLFAVPLNVGPVLVEQVYSKFPTIVLTSATLTVVGRFDFVSERIGLNRADADRLDYVTLPSPFNFAEQAIIGIPTDIPGIKDSKYLYSLIQAIFRCLTISQGRAFLLFTSFRMLDSVYSSLAPDLEKLMGIRALRQGDDNRTALLEKFRRDTSSVLFATLSFWEGVDVEGESLECVVLVKLPFKVPDEPVTQARAEEIERRGGRPFLEYSVPLAVIKFKQGFGRLIRNRTDHGAVLVLDKRVVERVYGRTFLNSLPPCRIVQGPAEYVFEEVQKFFSSFRRSEGKGRTRP